MIPIRLFPVVMTGIPITAEAASVEPVGADSSMLGSMLQVVLALGLVLGLIVLAAWLVRHFSLLPRQAGGVMRVVSGVMIGQRERVVVVEIRDQWLVLGVTPQSINLLSNMPKPEGAELDEVQPTAFANRLARALQQRIRPDSAKVSGHS